MPLTWRAADPDGRRLAAFYGAYFAMTGIVLPYLPLYFERRGLTALDIGVLIATGQAMRMVGPNLWGWLADRGERRTPILRATAIALAASFSLLLLPGGFGFVFAVMVLMNLFMTAQMPIAEALASSQMRGAADAAARYGRLRVWGSLSFVGVVLAAGPLFDRVGIGALVWVVLALTLVLVVAAFNVAESAGSQHAELRVSVRARLKEPRVRWFFISAALMVFAHGALYTYLSLYLAQLGYSKTAIGIFWVVSVVFEVGFFMTQGRWFARFGLWQLLIASFVVAAVRFLLIAEFATIWWMLAIAQCLHAVTFAVHHSASVMTIQRWFPGRAAARGQALYISTAYGVGGTAGSLIAAALWSQIGPSWAFIAGSVAALVGAVAARRARWLDEQDVSRTLVTEVDRSSRR
jgi:MFS transporter, PPP family, 3-phenylpropionic acid transporter